MLWNVGGSTSSGSYRRRRPDGGAGQPAWQADRSVVAGVGARAREPRPPRPRADAGSGACHRPFWGSLSAWPLLVSGPVTTRFLAGWPLRAPPLVVGHFVPVRKRSQDAGAGAGGGTGRQHRRAGTDHAGGDGKGRRRGWPVQHAADLEEGDREDAHGDEPAPEPHLPADQSALLEGLLLSGHVGTSSTWRALLGHPSIRSLTPPAAAGGAGRHRTAVLSSTSQQDRLTTPDAGGGLRQAVDRVGRSPAT